MKAYIAQVANNAPIQANTSNSPPLDPMVLLWIGLGGVGTFLASFIPKFIDSNLIQKSLDSRINKTQAETNSVVAEKLTEINIEKQFAESSIDLSSAVADIAKESVQNTQHINADLLSLVRESISASQLHAESRSFSAKATENLVDAQKGMMMATENIIKGMDRLTTAHEVTRKELLEAHTFALSESQKMGEQLIKRIYSHETHIKQEFAAVIAQFRRDLKDLESNLLSKISGSI